MVTSAALAARHAGGMDPHGSLLIGFGMLGRVKPAFVVLAIAWVEPAILSTEAFFTLIFTCVCLILALALIIRWYRLRYDRSIGSARLPTGRSVAEEDIRR